MSETSKHSVGDDIAIIGVGCRFPGDAENPTAFFDMLLAGRDAWKKTPIERFDADAFWHPHNARHGTMVVKAGYYLKEDVGAFDAPFFSMTKTEADAMDPQQRLLLEVAYECMENAGVPIENLAGTDTSCFVGGFTTDYDRMSTSDINDTLQYSATGNGLGMLSNRLSWFYNLQGPSMTVDTACSSSLVALHLACQAIRNKSRSRTALVGGVGLILSPDAMIGANPLKFFSPDSRCFSFDSRANGYARGEGAAVILLKHIDDAIRDGDTIRAVIRGTGVNQDGKTPGITLPNSQAQASLIRSTYAAAGLDLSETSYFEAHGTGTPAGDPLEMGAIRSTFGSVSRTPDRPIFVGTVKPNIGHLEGCAGLAGLLKATLALETGIIPPNLNFKTPNPQLHLDEWDVQIPLECTPWPTTATGLRRASVNSFGYGGTNAHVILDDASHYLSSRGVSTKKTNTCNPTVKYHFRRPESVSSSESIVDDDSASSLSTPLSSAGSEYGQDDSKCAPKTDKAYVFSGPDQAAVTRMMQTILASLKKRGIASIDEEFCTDLAYTLGTRRSVYPWRSSLIASSADEFVLKLSSETPKPTRAVATDSAQMVWVFTGQGAQWFAMGRELLDYEVFKNSVCESDKYLKSIGAPWSVLEELRASEEESKVNQASYSQPICTVLQIALVDLMHHWGLHATAVTGHSSGEIAAAYAAGALSHHDCLKVAFTRGHCSDHLLSAAPHIKGGMMSVGLSEEAAREYLDKLPSSDIAVVACVNSPSNVTVSGDISALDKLEPLLKDANIFARRLKVDHAYHSPHMKYVADAYFQSIGDIAPCDPDSGSFKRPVMISSVTGSVVSAEDLARPSYWVENMTSPVQFSKAVTNLWGPESPFADGKLNVIVEVGPHSALQGPLKQILKHNGRTEGSVYMSMLQRGRNAITTALEGATKLWCTGFEISMSRLNSLGMNAKCNSEDAPKVLPDLPSYPWNHSNRYWHCSSQQRAHLYAKTPRLDWLGSRAEDFNPLSPCWKNTLRVSELPWLADHCITDNIIYPGAGMMCCALEAARQMAEPGRAIDTFEYRDLTFGTALLVPDSDRGVEIFTQLKPRKLGLRARDAPWFEYTIYSLKDDGSHNEHSSGLIRVQYKDETVDLQDPREIEIEQKACQQHYQNAMEECTETMSIEEVYAQFSSVGMRFGPAFQCVNDVRMAPGKAVVTLKIPDTKSVMPGNFEHEHLLHPATLDGCVHGLIAATASERKGLKHVTIVTEIEYASISADIPRNPGSLISGVMETQRSGFRNMITSAVYYGPARDKPMITLTNLRGTNLGGMIGDISSTEDASSIRKVCSEIMYRDDVDMIQQKDAQRIFQQTIEDPAELSGFVHLAQQASSIYVDRALKATTEAIEASLPPHLIQYLQWMRKTQSLASDGRLRGLKSLSGPLGTSVAAENEFLEKFEDSCEDARLLCAVGKDLPGIMAGNVAPLDVMMKDDLLTKTYAQAHGVVSGVHMVKDWFSFRGHKQPSMKILEIGAGTGSITLPILQVLKPQLDSTARFDSYVFTDISTGFFEPARELLKDWQDLIEFQKLDIEKCPIEQGFKPSSFDVIAASNVLHATKDIATTLKNCHTLLKPGGKLVLGEITEPIEYLSLIYGTLPGWWRFEDDRVGGPCLSQENWKTQLVNAGFRAPGFDIAVKDTPVEGNHIISMMVATKSILQEREFQNISIITSTDTSSNVTSLSDTLVRQLNGLGLTATTTDLDTATSLKEDSTPQCADNFAIVLLETETSTISDLSEDGFYKIQTLLTQSQGILWVTCGSEGAGSMAPHLRAVSGLFRVLKAENTMLRLHELHLSRPAKANPGFESLADEIMLTFESITSDTEGELETEIVQEDGRLKIPRVVDEVNKNWDIHVTDSILPPTLQPLLQADRPLAMAAGVPGKLETLYFRDDTTLSGPVPHNEVEIEVQVNSLNYKDVMVAMGHVMDAVIGSDAAGIVRRVGKDVTRFQAGDRVAVLTRGAMCTTIRVDERLPQKIPDSMSMADASTLPTVFVTAYQVLFETARIRTGESILIHSAAGGLGQALIQICQSLGVEIYATVGSAAKRELLIEQYGISPNRIFSSRGLKFANGIMRETNGRGVDVIVNSLYGEALRHTLSCIAEYGRFIEVGMRDILANSGLDMEHFNRNTTFASVNVDHICRTSTPRLAYLMEKVFELLQRGKIKAANPVTVYDYSDFITGFRTMNDGTHMGKIVFEVTPKSTVSVDVAKTRDVLNLNPTGTYVIVGGLGGLGRGMATYLAERGANYLVFLSRSGAVTDESRKLLESLHSNGVSTVAYACDVADRERLATVLSEIRQKMPPIKGVIQSAMVLRDMMFENMTYDSWVGATRPKIQGTWNLHELMPKDLDFFVMLASSTAIIGNRGQANYCAGNTFQDALAHHRKSIGLPAVSLDLGAIRGIGWVAENSDTTIMKAMDRIIVEQKHFYSVLRSAITGHTYDDNKTPTQLITAAGSGGDSMAIRQEGGSYDLWWLQEVKFAYLRKLDTAGKKEVTEKAGIDVKAMLSAAASMQEAVDAIKTVTVQRLAKSMMISEEDIDVSKPVHSYGVDSLVAMDFRNWIFRELNSTVTVFDILDSVPLTRLAMQIAKNSDLVPESYKSE